MGAVVSVSYAPGDWVAVAGPGCWLLADAPLSDPAVAAFGTLLAGGVDGPGLLTALTDSGLVGLDAFAVVVAGDPGLALVRGVANVEIADEGGDVWTVDAEGAATWVEARLPDGARTVSLASGRDALADAAAAELQAFDGVAVGAELLVVDLTPQAVPDPLSGPHELDEAAPGVVATEVVGDAGELAAWADSGSDDVESPVVSEASTGDAEPLAVTDAAPPRPTVLPPRPPLPPTPAPPASAPPSSAATETSSELPARPAAPPPVTYAPGPEIDPTPTDRLRLGGRRGDGDRVPVPPSGRPDPAELLPTVLCPLGHANPPETTSCPRCGSALAPQQATPLPRPPMGVLELAPGETVAVDRGVLVGRTPTWPGAPGDRPHLVQLTSPLGDISRNHLEVTLRGWDVVAVDLGSMNGTHVTGADGGARELTAGEAAVLTDGDLLTIAEGVSLRYLREA